MLKKIAVLGKMLELGSFTIAQLSDASDTRANTVQTIVNRCPSHWLDARVAPTRVKGGQPKLYHLTELGQAEIRGQLATLPSMSMTDGPGGEPPLGLALADETMGKMRTALRAREFDHPKLEFWRDEAWGNLEWASNELDETSHLDWERRLAQLRVEVLSLDIERRRQRDAAARERVPVPVVAFASIDEALVFRTKVYRMNKPARESGPSSESQRHGLLGTLLKGLSQVAPAAA